MCGEGSLQKKPAEQISRLTNSRNLKPWFPHGICTLLVGKILQESSFCIKLWPGFPPTAGWGVDQILLTCPITFHAD